MFLKKINKNIVTYAAWSKDSKNVLKSSSGGIFFELAKHFIKNKKNERVEIY